MALCWGRRGAVQPAHKLRAFASQLLAKRRAGKCVKAGGVHELQAMFMVGSGNGLDMLVSLSIVFVLEYR